MTYRRNTSAGLVLRLWIPITVCCSVLLVGCDSNSSNEDGTSIAGSWVGSLTSGGTTQNLTLTLSEVENPVGGISVSGTGTVASTSRTVTFAVSGSYVHPILSLDAVFDIPPGTNPSGNISGQVNESRTEITATVTGPDVNGQVVFTRDD